MPKQYWVRFVYADRPTTETNLVPSQTTCWELIQAGFKSDSEIRFAYIMTNDAFGECFVELVRREGAA